MIRPEDFTSNLFVILEETFESPPRDGNAYLDKQTGWFHTLADVSAEQASRPLTPDGTSIAGQVAHATFYLEALEGFMTKRITGPVEWRESWTVRGVTPEEWEDLKQQLGATYKRVKTLLQSYTDWGDDEVGDALAILAHSAYHLGAVRQMVRAVR